MNKIRTVLSAIAAGVILSCLFPGQKALAANYSIVSAGAGAILDDTLLFFSSAQLSDETLSRGSGSEETMSISVNSAAGGEDGKIAGYTNLGVAHVDSNLNIREKPDEGSELIGKMTKNAGCEILDISGNWAHIKSGKVDGYAKTEFLYMGEEAIRVAQEVITLVATIDTTTLFVRESPDINSPVLTMVPMGEDYAVTEGEQGDPWLKIAIDDDEGWVSADYLVLGEQLDKAMSMKELKYGEGVSDVRVSLVNYAKQFIGNPYVWGGTSLTRGCDCSGYVQAIYRKYGISLPRTSRQQALVGKKINPADAQPGDLFYYAKYGTVSHVGIYIGNGQIVNAHSRRTGIRINSAYYRRPAVVRRVLD